MRLATPFVLAATVAINASAFAEEKAPEHSGGFHLRADAGIGNFSASSSAPSRSNRSYHGTTLSWAVFVGGGIAPGCNGGAALAFDRVYAVSGYDETSGPIDATGLHLQHRLLGPYFDCYFDPKGGVHAWALLGPAKVSVTRDGQPPSQPADPTPDPSGVGFQFGIGYDAWISSVTSFGIAFRLTYSPLSVDEIGSEIPVKILIPALVFNVTVN